jgi:predicted amidohydrolase YtcJ
MFEFFRSATRTLLIATLLSSCAAPSPDIIYVDGVVWTGDAETPWAEAIAVADGKILKVGTDEEIRRFAGSSTDTDIVDLEGAFVVPGFIDNHTHFLYGGFQLAGVQLRDAASKDTFVTRIERFAGSISPQQWITGGDWDHEAWGGELPERSWIDDVTKENPVFVSRLDGHMALANSLTLKLAGITADTPDPEGGTIVRNPRTGEPTGVLKDEAMSLVYSVMPDPSPLELRTALDRATEHALSLGVTQVHDVGSFGGWMDLEAFRQARSEGNLKIRIYSFVPLRSWRRLDALVAENGRGDEWLRWGGLKGFVDGSLGSTTAWFYDPYEDEPETSGLLVADTASIRRNILSADSAGLQIAVHAIGDQANDWLLDVYGEMETVSGRRDRRSRIEHAQHLSPGSLNRFASLGVVASMQPYHAIDDGRWAEKRIGPERIKTTYAFRSLLDAGAALTFGSDWTVAPIDPLKGIFAAVTRETIDGANPDGWVPEQKITVEEALRAYTSTNAWAGFMESQSGTLSKDKLADFVVLSRNLIDIDPDSIPDIRVLRTVIGGKDAFVLDAFN